MEDFLGIYILPLPRTVGGRGMSDYQRPLYQEGWNLHNLELAWLSPLHHVDKYQHSQCKSFPRRSKQVLQVGGRVAKLVEQIVNIRLIVPF